MLPPPLVKSAKPTVPEQIHERLPRLFQSAPRQCLLWGLVAALTCVWAKPDLRFLSFAVVSGVLGFATYTRLWRVPKFFTLCVGFVVGILPFWFARKLFGISSGVLAQVWQYASVAMFTIDALLWIFRKRLESSLGLAKTPPPSEPSGKR